jgi:2,5-diketo-D-gluconate reductase A
MDYVDLYLIHWPVPRQDKYLHAWEGLIRAREQGKVRSIGVSNFLPGHLERIVEATGVVPAVNQIELHPLFPQAELREVHREFGIVTESWSPLGRGRLDESEILARIAQKHGKSPAQIVLRWHVELGLIVIPKSVTPSRIRENFELFDFALDADDMAAIQSLDQGTRLGGDPAVAAYGVNL